MSCNLGGGGGGGGFGAQRSVLFKILQNHFFNPKFVSSSFDFEQHYYLQITKQRTKAR